MVSRSTTSVTVNLFLSGMALCYLWAFASLYPQIPGLYGPTGILPIHRLHKNHYSKSCLSMHWNDFKQNPSFFCLVNDLQISPIYMMELFCLIGIILASICILSHFIRHNLTFIIFLCLWLLYLSLFLVGQTFLSFQWDILLLECGFLCCFVSSSSTYSRYNDIIFFCLRWLIFRLMFASFVVKLQSKCPTWWGLTALDWHYQSTCIPSPVSWYFHYLPKWINHLSVVVMYIIEGPFSILYILPIQFGSKYIFRLTRLIAVYSNILLMIVIQFSGNYNFFNMLTIIVTCTCLDDEHINYMLSKLLFWRKHQINIKSNNVINKYIFYMLYLMEFVLWIAFILLVVHYFGLTFKKNNNVPTFDGWFGRIVNLLDAYHINSTINFSETFFNLTVSKCIMVAVIFGYINIICCIIADFIANFSQFLRALCASNSNNNDDTMECFSIIILCIIFIYRLICYLIKMCIGIFIFHLSLIPFLQSIDNYHYTKQYVINEKYMNYIGKEWYFQYQPFHLVNSYGLFRRMTGVAGRPEVEIFVSGDDDAMLPFADKYILSPPTQLKNATFPWDAAADAKRGWYRIPFLYKPGDLNKSPRWIAPHQPRLDWQMWFAALGRYENNAWFISFLYRLITPEQSSAVYDLIDSNTYIYSPYFVKHLKKQKLQQEERDKIGFMQRFGHIIFDSVFRFFADLPEDNEFDVVGNDYYKTEKKKRKKRKSKSKKLLEQHMLDYGYPKYITAVLYEYHYTSIESSSSCDIAEDDGDGNRKGIWWTRERKKEYFPVFKYNELDGIRDWMKSNGYLNRPIFDGESEMSKIVKCIRFIRKFYRNIYHQKYDVVTLIYGLTVTVLAMRLVHELVQTEIIGQPLT